jgi:3D (Asp-Asp-Asp) domain-containing protein
MLLLSRSLRRKLLATGLTALVFTLLYQATVFDSLSFGDGGAAAMAAPGRGTRTTFEATAYCRGITTASGIAVRAGIAASDPKVLPIGSVIQVDGVGQAYRGIYTVLDTGPEIQGRELDLYIWNCDEAVQFGRRQATVTVLRRGWNDGQPASRGELAQR